MKSGKFFRVLAALLSIIIAVALLAVGVLAILSYYEVELPLPEIELLDNLNAGIPVAATNLVLQLEFLSSLSDYATVVFVGAVFALPALLLIFAGAIMFTKQKRSKGKYVFAAILAILGIGIFTAAIELYADNLFVESLLLTCRIAVAGMAVLLIALLVLSLLGKGKKKGEVAENSESEASPKSKKKGKKSSDKQLPEAEAETVVAVPQETEPVVEYTQPIETIAPQTVEPIEYAQPQPVEPTYEQVAPQPAPQVEPEPAFWDRADRRYADEFVPNERKSTVSDIVQNTYRKQTDNISVGNVKKLHTLRSLLDAGALSKDEYIALVDKYLHDKQ